MGAREHNERDVVSDQSPHMQCACGGERAGARVQQVGR